MISFLLQKYPALLFTFLTPESLTLALPVSLSHLFIIIFLHFLHTQREEDRTNPLSPSILFLLLLRLLHLLCVRGLKQ